tara:strand:+ start:490 stop:621 length:132 start_codon:yes stop_codon:yes gene_type:complete
VTYAEDLLRLRDQEIAALRSRIEELEAKNEILNNQITQWQQEK